MVLDLPNGRRTRIRPIAPDDKALLQDGLQRLSPESVRRRFLGPKARLSAAELRYLTEVDGRDHIALVAVGGADPGGPGGGAGGGGPRGGAGAGGGAEAGGPAP